MSLYVAVNTHFIFLIPASIGKKTKDVFEKGHNVLKDGLTQNTDIQGTQPHRRK